MVSLYRLRSRLGFTLIEQLVVIAIIAVLIELLMPVIKHASQVARTPQQTFDGLCLHNYQRLFDSTDIVDIAHQVRLRSRLSTMPNLDQFFGQVRALSNCRYAGSALKDPPLEHCTWTTELKLPS